jgi:hypothetical protein
MIELYVEKLVNMKLLKPLPGIKKDLTNTQ